jgi:DNA-binding transcriptional MerR regulator
MRSLPWADATSASAQVRLGRRLQGLGLTLDEVTDALHVTDRGDATCESERWRLEAVLERIDAQVAELQATRQEIRLVMAACDAGECTFAGVGDERDSA